MGKNGGQKSLLAEIVGFGIDNLEPSEQNTLKKILKTVCTENGQTTLLDFYSKNSTDSGRIEAETSFCLLEFQNIGRYYSPEGTKSKLTDKIRLMQKIMNRKK